MPEGPSIALLKELAQIFEGKKLLSANGNVKIDAHKIAGKTVKSFKSWGKHFLMCFEDITLRIHFMLFGSYSINERVNATSTLNLKLEDGELNLYNCFAQCINEPLETLYDWSSDIMSDQWDANNASIKLQKHPSMMICDALLSQDIFAGSDNIIKNEVLFEMKIHPEARIGAIPEKKLHALIEKTRNYAFDFLNWKKSNVVTEHWQVYDKSNCPACKKQLTITYLGKTNRKNFFCGKCQQLYTLNQICY